MAELGLNQSELARRLKIGQSSVNRWLEGTNPQPRMMQGLAEALSVRMEWLQSGIGEKDPFAAHLDRLKQTRDYALSHGETPEAAQAIFDERLPYTAPPSGKSSLCFVPVVRWADAAACASLSDLQARQSGETVPTECMDPHALAVPVEGDSMETRVLHGDMAVVMPSEEPRNGCMVLARMKGNGVVLRRYEAMPGGKIRLIPYNERYSIYEYKPDELLWLYPVHSTFRREWS